MDKLVKTVNYRYIPKINLPTRKFDYVDKNFGNSIDFKGIGHEILAKQNRVLCFTGLNTEKILQLKIPNLKQVAPNGFRGETLSGKNFRFIKLLKDRGIDTIIDLRYKDLSTKYKEKCNSVGLNYFNFPIDGKICDYKDVIKKLPAFFDILKNDNYYIACAMGLHRTDIALAVNYIFNPTEQKIPKMVGHFRNNEFKNDKISEFLNKIKKNLTEENLKSIGWENNFDQVFQNRRNAFMKYNRELAIQNSTMV